MPAPPSAPPVPTQRTPPRPVRPAPPPGRMDVRDRPPRPTAPAPPARRMDPESASAPKGAASPWLAHLDLGLACAWSVVAAAAAYGLPDGSALRVAITLPFLILVPGYLLLQATVRSPPSVQSRTVQVLLGMGASPAVVTLLALSTSLVNGGFKVPAIVAAVAVGSLALGIVAAVRRLRSPVRHEQPEAAPAPVLAAPPRPRAAVPAMPAGTRKARLR